MNDQQPTFAKLPANEQTIKLLQRILKKKIKFNEIPQECQELPEVIQAERKAGFRHVGKRGYDVIRNLFFVEESGNPQSAFPLSLNRSFKTFDEFYQYLNGDIYKHSSYFQYEFSEEEIAQHNLNLEKLIVAHSLPGQ
jgi:hypothetical protein